MTAEVLQQIDAGLADFVSRPSQLANMKAFMAAVPLCLGNSSFNVVTLERAVTPPGSVSSRQLRHLLDAGSWSAEDLRIELLSCAVAAAPSCIVVECEEVRPNEGQSFDILSATLLNQEFCLPVAWERAWVPSGSSEVEIESFERNGIATMLARLCEDLAQLGLSPDLVPLLALDWRYGEMDGLRADLAILGFEYAFEVGPLYNALGDARYPEDAVEIRAELADRMPFGATGPLPDPVPIVVDSPAAPNRELVVPFRGQEPSYALVRPKVDARARGLNGPRLQRRARELGDLLGQTRPPRVADHLGVARLQHRDPSGWQAAATLISALSAAQQGLFPKGGS